MALYDPDLLSTLIATPHDGAQRYTCRKGTNSLSGVFFMLYGIAGTGDSP